MNPKRFFLILLFMASFLILTSADNPPPLVASPQTQAELAAAFFERLQTNKEPKLLTFDLFTPEVDTAFLSPDGSRAVIWLALRDNYGRILATEPGLVVAQLTKTGWQVILPGDTGWEETLSSLPAGMLPLEKMAAPEQPEMDSVAIADVYTGYYLPFVAGTSRWLEGSISHFQYIPELGYPSCTAEFCRYAFDFTDEEHFPLVAAKTGTVYATRDSCSNGNTGCTNYIVLQNANEGTYQIYLHLAYGTIPDKLTNGRLVQRGEYIGDSDDTGYSTSNHVHFMVTNSVWVGGDGYYWGRSVEINFADVPINNGIPRTCYEVTSFPIYDGAHDCIGNRNDPRNPANDWFLSGNVGAYPPSGTLSRPAAGITVASGSNPLMDVTANVSDDVRVSAAQLSARLNGQWVEVGPRVTSQASAGVFDWDVNLCNIGPLNGPLEVALTVWDHEGTKVPNLSPRTILVDHACPPPASQMAPAGTFDSTALRLNWQLLDAGIGVNSYQVQWRSNPGIWDASNILTFPKTQFSSWFAGQPGGNYLFRVRAVDLNGQLEPWPAGDVGEISVTLPVTCNGDTFEADDSISQAKPIGLDVPVQHSLCGVGNQDWVYLDLQAGEYYRVVMQSVSGGAAVKMSAYGNNETNLLTTVQSNGIGQGTVLLFNAATTDRYFLKIEPFPIYLSGTEAVYSIEVSNVALTYLPFVAR